MRVPKQVIIDGEAWDVEITDGVEDTWPDLPDHTELRGYTDHDAKRILINRDLDEGDHPAKVLLHELTHARCPHWSEARVRETEEALWPVLRDSGIWRRR